MVSAADIVDFQLPRVVHGSKNLSYYVGLGAILCVAWFFQSRKHKQIDVPYYKAAKTKWIFAAESLVLDSYNKVSSTVLDLSAPPNNLVSRHHLPNQGHRGCAGVGSCEVSSRAQRIAGGCT